MEENRTCFIRERVNEHINKVDRLREAVLVFRETSEDGREI